MLDCCPTQAECYRLVLSSKQIRTMLAVQPPKVGSALGKEPTLLQLVREFQNNVERTHWRAACFSHDSEYVVGASAAKAEHIMYVWSRVVGNLMLILEGELEFLYNAASAC